jgi:hypothetical protein
MASQHGTRTRYNTGCRCDECKQASREYDKRRRQSMLSRKHGPARVTALPSIPDEVQAGAATTGPVEAGVIAQIDGLTTAANRQGLVQIAIALARVLDSPLAIAQHASSGRVLVDTLEKIAKGSDARTGKLASVRSMTRKSEAVG